MGDKEILGLEENEIIINQQMRFGKSELYISCRQVFQIFSFNYFNHFYN